jgi:hypothetical protein
MKSSVIKYQLIMFGVMIIVGMLFNPMNILAYRIDDLYVSLTLFYGGLLMASNMMWAHELVHYFSMGQFNKVVFLIGIVLSITVSIFLLRKQLYVDDKQWLKRMISHHSTALTTSRKISDSTDSMKVKHLANDIINTQEREIKLMKSML